MAHINGYSSASDDKSEDEHDPLQPSLWEQGYQNPQTEEPYHAKFDLIVDLPCGIPQFEPHVQFPKPFLPSVTADWLTQQYALSLNVDTLEGLRQPILKEEKG